MFSEEQKRALLADLPPDRVASRTQSGRELSYVEGWWVIGELNRIFGPGGWSYDVDTRETVRLNEPDPKGDGRGTRWRVSYSAKCRLTVGTCTIGDVGHGHGIDRDCGNAIESAEKEAATDALKRAAKSLGWRLGLALYDKTQEHVREEAPQPKSDAEIAQILARMSESPEAKQRIWHELDAATKAQVKAAAAAKGAVK